MLFRSSSIRSYRDTIRLFLLFAAAQARRGVSELRFDDVGSEQVLAFLRDLEQTRHNAIATRNQRLAGLHTFYEYVGRRTPELLHVCAQVAAIPMKRCPRPETRFMAREEIQTLFAQLPEHGCLAVRDRTLLLFLYNTGARVSEVAGLRVEQLTLTTPAHVRLLGKGGKWRSCPLWEQTVQALERMIAERGANRSEDYVFTAMSGEPMTRFGIYKRVRRLVADADAQESPQTSTRRITPARVPSHDGGPSARSRRRDERDPRLAGAREPGDDQSVCRDHDTDEAGGVEAVRADRANQLGTTTPN